MTLLLVDELYPGAGLGLDSSHVFTVLSNDQTNGIAVNSDDFLIVCELLLRVSSLSAYSLFTISVWREGALATTT